MEPQQPYSQQNQSSSTQPQQASSPVSSSMPPDPTGKARLLAIAVVFSAVLLVAAVCVVVWIMFFKNNNEPSANNARNQAQSALIAAEDVRFAAPAQLPEGYRQDVRDTVEAKRSYYYNNNIGCAVFTGVTALGGGDLRAQAMGLIEQGQHPSIETVSLQDSDDVLVGDSETDIAYNFKSASFEQDISVAGASEAKQYGLVAYTATSSQVLVLAYTCGGSTWQAQQDAVKQFAQEFVVVR